MDLNRTCITGRLGRDPEVRFVNSGKAVCNLNVAVSGSKDSTTWITVTVWDKAAEACAEYLHKGSRVAVSGRLEQREWQDREGNKRTVIDLVADGFGGVVFLDPKGGASPNPPQHRPHNDPYSASGDDGSGDVPF